MWLFNKKLTLLLVYLPPKNMWQLKGRSESEYSFFSLSLLLFDLKICENSRKYFALNSFAENYFGCWKIISLDERWKNWWQKWHTSRVALNIFFIIRLTFLQYLFWGPRRVLFHFILVNQPRTFVFKISILTRRQEP